MNAAPELLLIAAVVAVGILHTMVPDHWMPIALIARQRNWTRAQTARAALQAGTGHVVSTLLIGIVVWIAGVAIATRFGTLVSMLSSIALIGFGLWIAVGAWRELHDGHTHAHAAGDAGSSRTALLLILGSSPMVEGIPAFFAASKYGAGQIIAMAIAFAISTIATYVVLCVSSSAGLQRLRFGRFEEYGEVISGGFISLVGLVFLVFPVL
ncbi:MAG: hypothetical protein NVSMB64_13070 [Candidatus Velthaea sp.]